MKSWSPRMLPAVDAVEIVDLRAIDPNRVSEYMQLATEAPFVRVAGRDSQPFAEAWRDLPEGEASRCHVPPVGLRFLANGVVRVAASVCWRCNNVFGLSDGVEISFAFDSASVAAMRLLALVREVIGPDVVGDG